MAQWLVFIICVSFASWAFGKCESMSLEKTTPTKFLIYHTDKAHRVAYEKYPIKFEVDSEELSQSETLFHISHGKKTNKLCTLKVAGGLDKSSLKQKDFLTVKSADFTNSKFTMLLSDKGFQSIECTGVTTMQDLKDVMEPYLMFNCKDKMAYQPKELGTVSRLPASKNK